MTDDDPQAAEDPDDEDAFTGWHTIQRREVAMVLAALIGALLIWVIFIFVHRGG